MEEYINLTDTITDLYDRGNTMYFTNEEIRKIRKWLGEQELADVRENSHAKWDKKGQWKICTRCKSPVSTRTIGSYYWKYCPHCGAKMDEVVKTE